MKDSTDPLAQADSLLKSYRQQIFSEYNFQQRYRVTQLGGIVCFLLFKWRPAQFLLSSGLVSYYLCPELFSVFSAPVIEELESKSESTKKDD